MYIPQFLKNEVCFIPIRLAKIEMFNNIQSGKDVEKGEIYNFCWGGRKGEFLYTNRNVN